MTATTVSEESLQVGGTTVKFLRGGAGRPLVFLHGVEGPEGWLEAHEALAAHTTVYAPTHPGYGDASRPEWIETNSHLALFYLWFLQQAGLQQIDLVGTGVGGWIAAEMAVMCPQVLSHLVLVDAAGVRPKEGEIRDIFVMPWREMIEHCFYDASQSSEYGRIYGTSPVVDFGGARESGRSMALRTCYRPYMHDPALLPMLGRVQVPALIVWGADDQIVPLECGHLYQEALPDADLRIIDRCGHWPHFEQPRALAGLIHGFVSR